MIAEAAITWQGVLLGGILGALVAIIFGRRV